MEVGVNATPQPLYLRERPGTYLYRRLGRPQGWSGQVQKILPPLGFDPRTIQPIGIHYTDYSGLPKAGPQPFMWYRHCGQNVTFMEATGNLTHTMTYKYLYCICLYTVCNNKYIDSNI
jgi:hypothetical protein